MDSFGNRLRETREKLNLSVEQVSRDTHIARRYVEGLEREDLSGFPGETYAMGFLRNYALFLSLNPDEMLAMYKNLRLQEQPVPMTELLEARRPASRRLILFLVLGAIVLAGGGFGIYRLVASRAGSEASVASQPASEGPGESFVLSEPAVVRWFSQGDRITIPFGALEVLLRVIRIEQEVYLEMPGGVDIFGIGDRKRLDLNDDGTIDLQIQLNSVDTTAGQRKANIGLYKIARPGDEPQPVADQPAASPATTGVAEETAAAAVEPPTVAPVPAPPAAQPPPAGESMAAPVRDLQRAVVVLREAEAAGPFSLSASFDGRCLFRFQVDDAERQTRLFLKGAPLQLEAERELRLWASNAGVVDIRIAGKQLSLGRQGEVASVHIRWVRDPETRKQSLRAYPLY
jgi:cytoskeletal protein RodZ